MSWTIAHLGGQGDGVALTPDGPRYVPGTAPGDIVDIDGNLLAAGPNRATPPCPHFGPCGGCQLQQVARPAYAAWLGDRIAQALSQHGLAAPIRPAHVSPPGSRRRVAWRAARKGKTVVVGTNAARSHDVIDLRECPVTDPAIVALLPALRTLLIGLLADRQSARITLTRTDAGIDLLLGDLKALSLDARMDLASFADAHGLARIAMDGPSGIELVSERDAPRLTLGGLSVGVPAGAFLQATPDGEAALIAAVRAAVGEAKQVADLFCGLGTFALPLSEHARVTAADAAGPLTAALRRASDIAQRGITVLHRDLFRRPLTPAELTAFAAVVFDPPRAGAKEQASALAQSAVPTVVAVSCNPSTFARDAELLVRGGYQLEWVQPVGQFLWSTHVELVARFCR
jgi:23S rRNA (uracil1939-C5)-methyltransferase